MGPHCTGPQPQLVLTYDGCSWEVGGKHPSVMLLLFLRNFMGTFYCLFRMFISLNLHSKFMNFLLTISIIYLPINNDNRVTLTQQKDIYFFTITLQAHNKHYNFMQ